MAKKPRNYEAELERRNARARAQGFSSYAALRRVDKETRQRAYAAQARVDATYARYAPARYLPGGKKVKARKSKQEATQLLDGKFYGSSPGAIRRLLAEMSGRGERGVTLAITFQGRRTYVDMLNAPEVEGSVRLPPGSLKGTSSRGGLRCTGVDLWTGKDEGFDPLDLLGFIEAFGNPSDALYELWNRSNESPTMGRDRKGRKRYRGRR